MKQKHKIRRGGSLSTQLSLFILILTTTLLITIVFLNYNSSRKLVREESIEHAQDALDNTILLHYLYRCTQ